MRRLNAVQPRLLDGQRFLFQVRAHASVPKEPMQGFAVLTASRIKKAASGILKVK